MKAKKKYIVSVLAAALVWGGCQPDADCDPVAPKGNLKLTVAAVWDGVQIDDASVYTNVQNYKLNISQFRVYLGDLNLRLNGADSLITRIELYDLLAGEVSKSYSISPATYDGLNFGIGVPSDLNNADPVSYGPDHPLYLQTGTYWSWTAGYRFALFEGNADTTGTGMGPLDLGYSLHPGLDTAYREITSNQAITIAENSTTDLRIEFEMSNFFYSATDTIDLSLENQLHGNNSYLNDKLATLMQGSVTVSQ